jgi:hypothetical protein
MEERTLLSTFTVMNTDDGGPGSLRQAILDSNAQHGADTITFDTTAFATPQTITLTSGQLELSDTTGATTITGAAAGVTVSAGGASRVFQVDGGVTASMSGLTITGGSANNGGGLANNGGNLTLTDCTVSGNAAGNSGGGVYTNGGGTTTLTNGTVSDNSASYGGGVSSNYGRTLTLTDCTVIGNSASGGPYSNGAGVDVSRGGTATLTDCTITGNSAGSAAGMMNFYSTATLTNCTITGNSADGGGSHWSFAGNAGGLANYGGTTTLTDCTVTGNSADHFKNGGGLNNNRGTITLNDCTISGNSAFFGGGVMNRDTMTLFDCTVNGNSTKYGGGGGVASYGTLTVSGCTVSGNSTDHSNSGGGLLLGGTTTVSDCTISGNSAGQGGGICVLTNSQFNYYGAATLTNCTVSGNTANSGGGLENFGSPLTLTNCTVSDNTISGYSGGGGLAYSYFNNSVKDGKTTLTNTIVAGNTGATGADDISHETTVSGNNNLIGTGGSGGLTDGQDGNIVLTSLSALGLAPLGFYGGPTQTMALLTGSPALGQGTIVKGVKTDQRGFPLDKPVDIGAFQGEALMVESTSGGVNTNLAQLTLAGAVSLADASQGGASPNVDIFFDPTVFATMQTITLTGSALELSDTDATTTILGPAAGVTISGGGQSGVFQVDDGVTASLSGLTITGGESQNGGGVLNYGTITLSGCTVSGNSVKYDGGGVLNYGTITLSDCTVSGNSAGAQGAGLASRGGTTTLNACTISGNSSAQSGGGILVLSAPQQKLYGTATLTNCTVSGNSAEKGAGLGNVYSAMTLTNCTVSGNTASFSGGGGGLNNTPGASGHTSTTTLYNTILADNTGPGGADDISPGSTVSGSTVSGSYNLIGTGGSGGLTDGQDGNIILTSPGGLGLGLLGSNGGPTQTMALLPGSPALEAGSIDFIPSDVTTDQRGSDYPRIVNGTVDIGAVEFSGSADESQTISFSALAGQIYGATAPVNLTATASSNLPVSFAIISGPATISGSTLTITGAGNVVVEAFQDGNDVYAPAAVVDQTLSVNTATLTIKPNAGQSKVYGAAMPGLTATATGFVNGDTDTVLTGALGTSATASSAVGSYAFTLGSLSAGPNYTMALAVSPPSLAVTRAPLSIQPNAGQSKVYGAAVAGLTETATGFVNGDTDTLLTGALGTSATASSAVGSYAFTLGSLSAGPNYTLVLATSPPTFAVTKAPLSIQPNTGQSKVYGAAVPGLTETPTGFVNGDTASLLTGALGTKATASSAAGTYAFTLGSLSAGANYTLVLAASPTFAITPVSMVITANSASITSSQALPVFTASYAGFVNGDTSASLTTSPTLSTTASAGSPAGTYSINASGASSTNYTITYVPGTLTVTLPLATVQSVSIQKIKLSKHKTVQGIVLRFSEALESADAQNLSAYTLATVAKNKKQKSKPVPLSSATYNSSAFTVTLVTRKTLALNPPLDLTVRAASLLDALGRELDGNHSGHPGSNFTAVLSKAGASVTSARIRGLSSHAVDAVLAAGLRWGR